MNGKRRAEHTCAEYLFHSYGFYKTSLQEFIEKNFMRNMWGKAALMQLKFKLFRNCSPLRLGTPSPPEFWRKASSAAAAAVVVVVPAAAAAGGGAAAAVALLLC